MTSAVVSTSAASGRFFVFDEEAVEVRPFSDIQKKPAGAQATPQSVISSIIPASRLGIHPAPQMVSSGIAALDALTGGLPRGCLTEICGPASSGRTTVLHAALAAATRRGEFCALVDASDALDPHSAVAAGVELKRLLWVRCGEIATRKEPPRRHRGTEKTFSKQRGTSPVEHRLEQVLRATDLLLESGGFGLIILDLADLPLASARRIPLTTWFRFRRAVEHTPTILVAIEQQPIAGSCSSLLLQLGPQISEKAMQYESSDCSREAAAWESPARQCRVSSQNGTESRRACPEQAKRVEGDGTIIAGAHIDHPTQVRLLTGLKISAEMIRSRLERKPARSVNFETKTAWAG